MGETSLISEQKLMEFLHERLSAEVANAARPLAEDTVWYLGNLLVQFSDSKQLFVEEFDRLTLPTLAFLYRDAREADTPHEKNLLLRKLGDTALFVGALFPEAFLKRGIRKDYFIGMGGGAYSYLADNALSQQDVFAELSRRFPNILELISRVCAKDASLDAQDIFDLYQRWQTTKDELIKKQLEAIGITPIDNNTRH